MQQKTQRNFCLSNSFFWVFQHTPGHITNMKICSVDTGDISVSPGMFYSDGNRIPSLFYSHKHSSRNYLGGQSQKTVSKGY